MMIIDDDHYPTAEEWAELRKTGTVCGTCNVRVWPAPAAGNVAVLTDNERAAIGDAASCMSESRSADDQRTARRLTELLERTAGES